MPRIPGIRERLPASLRYLLAVLVIGGTLKATYDLLLLAMFRHERPQKGRYRQFHQIGVEVFNLPGPDIDAEMFKDVAKKLFG